MPMPPLSDGGIAMPATRPGRPAGDAPVGSTGRRRARRIDRPATRPLRRRWSSPAASPRRCPARGEPFARDGRCGTRLSDHLRQFGNPCHADGGAPVRRIGPPVRRIGPPGRPGLARQEGFRTVPAFCRGPGPGRDAQPSGFPCGEQATNLEPGHVASKYVVARSVAKCLSDLRTVPVA